MAATEQQIPRSWRLTMIGVLLILGPVGATELPIGNLPQLIGNQRFQLLDEFGGNAVFDRNTQLVWERAPSQADMRWANAAARCALKLTGGKTGWQLPSFLELMTLLDPSIQTAPESPALPAGHPFRGVRASAYWTVTSKPEDPSRAYAVDFSLGDVASPEKAHRRPAWCVRGGMFQPQKRSAANPSPELL